MDKSSTGFTLIELMIVMAIIGILAAIALPAYQDYISRSHVSETLVLADGLKNTITEECQQQGTCVGISNGSHAIAAAADIKGRYTNSVTVTDGNIEALIGGVASATVSGKKIFLRPSYDSAKGSVIWTCTSDADNKYLPFACRQ